MSVPGIGAKVADKILELREAKGDLELDDLNQVPYLRITQPLLDCLDFTGPLLKIKKEWDPCMIDIGKGLGVSTS
jgi:predicted DNA-binding helix-hairpin-helix protein